jgi:hypothetical protein
VNDIRLLPPDCRHKRRQLSAAVPPLFTEAQHAHTIMLETVRVRAQLTDSTHDMTEEAGIEVFNNIYEAVL